MLFRSHPANLKPSWYGDSVGHYEGDTLVVDTVGVKVGPVSMSDAYGTPQSEALHVVERFTRVDENTINYDVVVDDPRVFTSPWKVAMPLNREPDYQLFEYACHEGNHAIPNTLSAGRARDQAARGVR